MEFRKEKSLKSKELIKAHSKSNIFNIDTGYYKTEKIYPISPKPTEMGPKLIEFTPKYDEMKHYQRKYINFLSDIQKNDKDILNLKPSTSRKNFELEKNRTRNMNLRQYCYDKNGNFSSKKLYLFDLSGKRDIFINNIKNLYSSTNNINNLKIKEKKNSEKINKYTQIINKSKSSKNIILKPKKVTNIDKYTKALYTKRNSNVNNYYNDNNDINNNDTNNYNKNDTNNNNNNLKDDINEINSLMKNLSPSQKKETLNYIKNFISNNFKTNSDIKINNNKNNNLNKSLNQNFNFHKKNKNKLDEEFEIYNIEIKNNIENIYDIDGKKVKKILCKNSLHVYQFNEDETAQYYKNKKIKAKIRKMTNDKTFEERYKRAEDELNKSKLKIEKRKATPGKELKRKKNFINLI